MQRVYRGWAINPYLSSKLKAQKGNQMIIADDMIELKQVIDLQEYSRQSAEIQFDRGECLYFNDGRCGCDMCDQYRELVSKSYCEHCKEWRRPKTW